MLDNLLGCLCVDFVEFLRIYGHLARLATNQYEKCGLNLATAAFRVNDLVIIGTYLLYLTGCRLTLNSQGIQACSYRSSRERNEGVVMQIV